VTFTDKLRTLLLRQHVESRSETEIFESPDESIREYLRSWGFSKQYINNFISPFYGGITLDRTLSTSKRVFEYTFKSLATGRAAIPAAGMGMIAKQLESRARTAGVSIVTNRSVESIHRTNSGVDIETENDTISADAGVIATDPKEATRLSGVTSIPTDARGSVTQYYRLPFDKNPISSTKLLLNAESASPNTIAPLSSVAPEYAPPGESLLSATFINEGAQHRSPDRLVEETRETLSAWYPDTSWADFEVVETTAVPFAQFAQPPGIHDQLPDVDAPDGPLYLAGDYTTWSAIQGALRSGREAAGAVRRDFPSSV
jgi:phytoene dehydrogenase-like protein